VKSFLQKAAQILMVVPLFVMGLSLMTPLAAQAETVDCSNINVSTSGVGAGAHCVAPAQAQTHLFGTGGIFVTVTNILIFVIGAIAVLMLIIGGIRYTVSQGDQNAITGAKNTILYAIIGIVVAVLAYGAVQFVTSQLSPTA
jgi:hypothetical protein